MTNTQTTKYAIRQYKCPECGNLENHGTNHFGEIYCHCKKCKSTPLYCIEPEAIQAQEQRKQDYALLHYYRFDISNAEEKKQYAEMCSRLEHWGLIKWDYVGLDNISQMEKLNGQQVTIYDKEQFDNQYVSNVGRIFNWKEQIYPNRQIKCGYYLTHIDNSPEQV